MQQLILLVDDDVSIRENYLDVVMDMGYAAVGCRDVIEAADLFSERKPDLVLLDISMNGDRQSGHKLCHQLKTQSPSVPVIMLTSLDNSENRQIALKNNADGYLIKQADPAELMRLIKNLLSARSPLCH